MHEIIRCVVDKKSDVLKTCKDFAEREGDPLEGSTVYPKNQMHFHEENIYRDLESAKKAIKKWDDGWYSDHAVRFRDTDKAKLTKKYLNLKKRMDKNRTEKSEYIQKHSVHNLKAKLISCPNCGSKITKVYLNGEYCPVCKHDLRAEYIVKRIKKYDADYKLLEHSANEEKVNCEYHAPIKWLFKAEIHC